MLTKLFQKNDFGILEINSQFYWEIELEGNDRFEEFDPDLVDKLLAYGPYKSFFGTHANDTFVLNTSLDNIVYLGDEGDDVVAVAAQVAVLLDGEEGNDTLSASAQVVKIWGGSGNDIITGKGTYYDVLKGGRGDDEITSLNAQFSYLDGGNGNDEIRGGSGNDWIIGGADNDDLSGGRGDDEFNGGLGADKFVFDERNWGDDVITDFEDGIDRLIISSSTGANEFRDLTITTQLNPATTAGYQALVRYVDPSAPNFINEITLHNIQASQLTDADFYFA
ncbi:MAG: calcium-binding protein [Filomicrobium sp.]